MQERAFIYVGNLGDGCLQVLGDNTAEAEKLFAGEPETSLIAAILWAFEVCMCTRPRLVLSCLVSLLAILERHAPAHGEASFLWARVG